MGFSLCRLVELSDGARTLCRKPGRHIFRQGEPASPLFDAEDRYGHRLAGDCLAKCLFGGVAKRDLQRFARHHGSMTTRQLVLKHRGHGFNEVGRKHIWVTHSHVLIVT